MGFSTDFRWDLEILWDYHPEIMWVKQCQKPPMTGNGKFIQPIKMVTGGWFMTLFYPQYSILGQSFGGSSHGNKME